MLFRTLHLLQTIQSRFSRLLLCSITLSMLSTVTNVPAQETAGSQSNTSDSSKTLEEVIITGTRMRGAVAPVGSDIISLDREYIEQSNSVSVDKLLQESPQIFNLGVSEASRGQPGGNGNITYGNSVNLRGIGPFSTLVLIDGHRVVTNSRNIEPSVLPMLGLERVEIVPDGASAIYGSDAIAGVVNLIPRRNVNGGQILARYGFGEDYNERRVGAAWGKTWSRGQFFAAYENAYRSNLNGRDRNYFRALQSGNDYRVPQCDPGNIIVGGVSYAIPAGGVTPANAASLTAGTQNLCEPRVEQDMLPEQEINSGSFTFNYELTDWLEFFADGFYSQRDFNRKPAFFSGDLTVPNTNAFFVDPTGTNPARVTVQYNFGNDIPADVQTGDSRYREITGGFKTKLPRDWRFEALFTYGEDNEVSNTTRGLDTRGLTAPLASSDPATAFDPFGMHRTSASVLDAISDQIFLVDSNVDFLGIELHFDGPLFELPGGTVQLAGGYERQDMSSVPGLARGNPGTPSSCVPCNVAGVDSLDRTVDSFYGELLIPLIGSGNVISGIRSLDLRVAVRYDDYSDVGNTINPQLGVNWSPLAGLTVRGSYGTSFRAPQFSDLFGNSSAMFVEAFPDPTIGGASRQGVFQSGGNPDLQPETATTWSVGFDWQPDALPGARLSMTYFDVEYKKQIQQYLGDNNILNREAQFAGTGIILRDAAAAARIQELFAQGLGVARGVLPNPVTLYVDGRPNNLGVSDTGGIDFQILYQWSNTTGDYSFTLGGTYLTKYKLSITPTGDKLDKLNDIFNPLEFKARAGLAWKRGPYSARLVINHVGGYDNDLASPVQNVDSFTPVDLNASYAIGDQEGRGLTDAWVVGLDISNIFDEDPPYVNIAPTNNGSGGYDATASNPVGRLIGVTVSKRF